MMKVWQPTAREIEETEEWGIWTKEVSAFPWEYSDTETCYILEGSAEVTDNQNNRISFKVGDMVRFQKGLQCTWRITSDIRKRYIFR